MTSDFVRSTQIQLARLRRHYDACVRTYDEVALLDLAHILRTWAELQDALNAQISAFETTSRFKSATPSKQAGRAARGNEYVLTFMPTPVTTFANRGELASYDATLTEPFSCRVEFHSGADGGSEFGGYGFVTNLAGPLNAGIGNVVRTNYTRWLGAEIVRLAYRDTSGGLIPCTISRETLIKRVANVFGGSHPGTGHGADTNQFDPAVRYLMRHKVGGLPLPYFLLLGTAQVLLPIASDFLQVQSR